MFATMRKEAEGDKRNVKKKKWHLTPKQVMTTNFPE